MESSLARCRGLCSYTSKRGSLIVMSNQAERRTLFEDAAPESLLHIARYKMRSFVDNDGRLNLAAAGNLSHTDLRNLDEGRHPLHEASVEVVKELALQASNLLGPSKAIRNGAHL